MKVISLSLVVIRSANIEAALNFYRVIGLNFVQEQHGSGVIHYSCDLNGIVLEIYPLQASSPIESETKHTTMLGFEVESLDETLSKLNELGIAPKGTPKSSEYGRWVNVADPDGRKIQINEK